MPPAWAARYFALHSFIVSAAADGVSTRLNVATTKAAPKHDFGKCRTAASLDSDTAWPDVANIASKVRARTGCAALLLGRLRQSADLIAINASFDLVGNLFQFVAGDFYDLAAEPEETPDLHLY